MTPDIDVEETLDWDIRESRIEEIGVLVQAKREAFLQAKLNADQQELYRYITIMDGIYLSIYSYISDDETDVDVEQDIEEPLDALNNRVSKKELQPNEVMDIVHDAKEVDKALQTVRKDINLDLPVKRQMQYGQGADE